MMKSLLLIIPLIIVFCNSCRKSNFRNEQACFFPELNEESYILGAESDSLKGVYDLKLEDNTHLIIKNECLNSLVKDTLNKRILIDFRDGRSMNINYLDSAQSLNQTTILNPSGFSPLTAVIKFKIPLAREVKIRIPPRSAEGAYIYQVFEKDTCHEIPVFGLYNDYITMVSVSILNRSGADIIREDIAIQTAPCQRLQSGAMEVLQNNYNKKQKNRLFLIQNAIYDGAGAVRWYTTHKGNKFYKIDNQTITIQIYPDRGLVANGCDIRLIDLLGNTIDTFNVQNRVHREIAEKPPGGNLLVGTNAVGHAHTENYSKYREIMKFCSVQNFFPFTDLIQ